MIQGFVGAYREEGIRIIANFKQCILASHPEYERLFATNSFFMNPGTSKPGVARLWSPGGGESGEGGHLDFSSKAAFSLVVVRRS